MNWERRTGNQRFDVLPEKRKREIEDTARTGVPERVECLHWAVMNHAEVCPEDIALIDAGSGRSVSYGELKAGQQQWRQEFQKRILRASRLHLPCRAG